MAHEGLKVVALTFQVLVISQSALCMLGNSPCFCCLLTFQILWVLIYVQIVCKIVCRLPKVLTIKEKVKHYDYFHNDKYLYAIG